MPTVVTHTLKPSGGDYTSLAAWEAAQARDLVAADQAEVLECYKGDYSSVGGGVNYTVVSSNLSFAGFTCDDTHYVKILTPASERHTGVLKDGAGDYTGFTIKITANWVGLLTDNKKLIFEGLACHKSSAGGPIEGANTGADAGQAWAIHIDKCLLINDGTGNYCNALNFSTGWVPGSSTWGALITNCIAKSGSKNTSRALYVHNWKKLLCYNCTFIANGSDYAVEVTSSGSFGAVTLKNCIAKGGAIQDFLVGYAALEYCASSDATADDAGGTGNRINQTFTFVDTANDDYHLASTDTGAKDHGVDLSADSNYAFDWDIDGETRTAPWDIGADQYVSSGGGPSPTTLSPSGIATAEAFGTASLTFHLDVLPTGISTGETFGSHTVTSIITVSPTGITTSETFGSVTIQPGDLLVTPTGVVSGEAFGTASIVGGDVTLAPSGITSAEAFGSLLLDLGLNVSPSAIASSETFGAVSVDLATFVTLTQAIQNGEVFGSIIVSGGTPVAVVIRDRRNLLRTYLGRPH